MSHEKVEIMRLRRRVGLASSSPVLRSTTVMRRKLLLAAILLALCAVLFATSASAFDHHFTVRAKRTLTHEAGPHTIRFKDKLVDPHNRHDRVGRDHGKCRVKGHKLKCNAFIHLNGKIGGKGAIRVRGDLQDNDHRLRVFDGSRQFKGVGGKMMFHIASRRFDLVR